jgi:HK97 family phage major capsid protein
MSTTSIAIQQKQNSRSILIGQLSSTLLKPASEERAKAASLLELEIANLDADITSLLKIQAISERAGINASAPLSPEAIATSVRSTIHSMSIENAPKTEQRKKEVNAAFRSFFRNGLTAENRDIVTAAGTSGGEALIPTGFDGAFNEALKFYGPIATLIKQLNESSGAPVKQVISDDTAATMTYIAEDGSTSGIEDDPTISSTTPDTDSLVTVVKYSFQELNDAFDFETFISRIAGLRVARAVEHALTLGKDNGTNTALPNSPTGGLLGNVTQGAVTSSLSEGIPYASLASLAASVDHAYYVNGAFMASPSVFSYLVSQVDSTGRPLYRFNSATGLLQIAGKPLYVNAAMPAYNAASSPVVLFGDYSRAYTYVNGGGVRIKVLRERFADVLEGAAVIYQRLGAQTLVSGAVKSLVTAAS